MANPGEGPGPLFLDQTEARIASPQTSFGVRLSRCVTNEPQRTSEGRLRPEGREKIFLETGLPRLSKGLDDRPLPPHPNPPPLSQGLYPALTFEQHAPIEPPRSSFSFVSVCFQGYIGNTKKCTIHCCH